LEDKEIKAIIEGGSDKMAAPSTSNSTPRNQNSMGKIPENEDLIILEEGFLRIRDTRPTSDQLPRRTPPASPISPRPWYKRPMSGTRAESSIPFKREVVLKTMEKRKVNKEKDELPEVGFCRNSISDPGSSKFNLFARIAEKTEELKKKDSEKRKSGIGIPNISELDREAAEIISKENSLKLAQQREEDEKYYQSEVQVNLRTTSVILEEYEEPKRRSARELINKFEANTTNLNRASVCVSPKTEPIEEKKPAVKGESQRITESKNLLGSWKCPYCTVDNQNWRIICQVCDKIKPGDKANVLNEPPVSPNYQIKKSVPVVGPKTTDPKNTDWDKKTEKVLQYFQPKETTMNGLSKSASENCVGSRFNNNRKPIGNSKLIGSPKMGVRSLIPRSSPEKPKQEIPDLVPTQNGVNLDDIRNARIAKFNGRVDERKPTSPRLDDARKLESLEREKERLREMIRAMNAKALAEKYPVIHKPPVAETPPSKIPQSPKLHKIRKELAIEPAPVMKPPTPEMPSKIPQPSKQPKANNEMANNDPTKLGAIKKYFGETEAKSKKIQNGFHKPEAEEQKLVLNNDTNRLRYELMDQSEFRRKNVSTEKLNGQVRFDDEITHQMKSQNGSENIKATLRYTSNGMNKTNTLAINKILRNLENAISDGQHDLAAQLAVDLAKMKVSLSVTRQKGRPLSGVDAGNIK
jgi:RanBP-type and C3HC4-type zinc finger-containing protein 1